MKHLFASVVLASITFGAIAAPEKLSTIATSVAAEPANAKLEIKGATTSAATQPLLIIADGKTVRDPTVAQLATFFGTRPSFKVVQVTPGKTVSRIVSKSASGPDFLEFDVAASMLPYAKLKVGSELTAQVQKAGASTLVRIMAGTVPVGFMTSEDIVLQ